MTDSRLHRLCTQLVYTKSDSLTEDTFSETFSAYRELCSEFGEAAVLVELSTLWSQEKAALFFDRMNPGPSARRQISTVAVHYHRAHSGGVERVQAQLITLWVKMGYRVLLLTEEPENPLDYPYPAAVQRFLIPRMGLKRARLTAIAKICTDENVDIFVNHNWLSSTAVWECILLKSLNIPFIQYVHGHFAIGMRIGRSALSQPALFRLCDLIIALSQTNARFFQLCGCRSYLVDNPVPDDLIEAADISSAAAADSVRTGISSGISSEGITPAASGSRRILLVGRLSYEKYPMDALKIFKKVSAQLDDVFLDIVGDGTEEFTAPLKKYVRDNGLDSRVIFHGARSTEELRTFYRNASCVLLTSEMEGYPMTVLESKAYGLPLVMYELPYLTLTRDGRGILTARFGDRDTMAEHLVNLLTDASLRTALASAARESFETFRSYDLEGAWSDIFRLCTGADSTPGSGQTLREHGTGSGPALLNPAAYYDPAAIPPEDRYIAPVLFRELDKGYARFMANNAEYRAGSALLKLPRKIKNRLRRT